MARKAARDGKKASEWARILVATDFSPDSVRATEVAAQLASKLGAEIILVHADEPLVEAARSNEHARRRRISNTELERVTRALEADGLRARWLLRVGPPAREIVDAAAKEDVQLVVIGTRGYSAAISALLGGVAYDVVRKAPCAVVTVRATKPTRRKPAAARSRTTRRTRPR
jgi:nucleotide-binding universal stress UspA family protein